MSIDMIWFNQIRKYIAGRRRGVMGWAGAVGRELRDYRKVDRVGVASGKTVHAHFTQIGKWRRYYLPLLACFREAGYQITFSCGPRFFSAPEKERFGFFSQPWILWGKCRGADLIITDDRNFARKNVSDGGNVCFLSQDDFRGELSEYEFRLPFMMHPQIYIEKFPAWFDQRSNNKPRRIRLFFAGNLDGGIYDSPLLGQKFGVHSRREIVRWLEQVGGDDILWVRTWKDKEKLSDIDKPIVIVDSYKAGLTLEEYSGLLGETQCFLAVPGAQVPFCHNLTESIGMGCIPLLEFYNLMSPLELKQGINCFGFSSREEFEGAVRMIVSRPDEGFDLMRGRLAELWDDVLSCRAIASSIVVRATRGRMAHAYLKAGWIPDGNKDSDNISNPGICSR